jgi:CDP-diacylglycerol--glycerol-3-phosphate 3-phosphatidyltransferase
MTQLPNIITLLRIAGSMGLLFCDVMGVAIWIIYGLCGISDIVDGWLARKLKCVTKKGALLDNFMFMLRELMFAVREYISVHCELISVDREYNFSRCKNTSFY